MGRFFLHKFYSYGQNAPSYIRQWVKYMNDAEFEREMNYQIIMFCARRFARKGLITADEYNKIDEVFLDKYRPIIGSLLSENHTEKGD